MRSRGGGLVWLVIRNRLCCCAAASSAAVALTPSHRLPPASREGHHPAVPTPKTRRYLRWARRGRRLASIAEARCPRTSLTIPPLMPRSIGTRSPNRARDRYPAPQTPLRSGSPRPIAGRSHRHCATGPFSTPTRPTPPSTPAKPRACARCRTWQRSGPDSSPGYPSTTITSIAAALCRMRWTTRAGPPSGQGWTRPTSSPPKHSGRRGCHGWRGPRTRYWDGSNNSPPRLRARRRITPLR